jgi:hypothetical protein
VSWAAGFGYSTIAVRNMRALGDLLIILGLSVAAFVVRSGGTLNETGARQVDEPSVRRPVEAPAAVPSAPVSQTIYIPTRRTATLPTATVFSGWDLVRQLQHELTRVGCYEGDINGIWTPSTRRAMEALIGQLNAKLPTAHPEPAHLALVQGEHERNCGQCPAGDKKQSGRKCIGPPDREVRVASVAPSLSPEPMAADLKPKSQSKPRHGRRGPIDGQMGLGVNGELPQTTQVDANQSVADHRPRSPHRATRHGHRTLVVQRPQRYLRGMRPARYAYRRPRGLFALLFGW